jgi:hypothetical protein
MSIYLRAVVLFLCLLLAGCATFAPQHAAFMRERPAECKAFLNKVDKAVGDAGARNAASAPIPGFPYLRTTRFLSAIGKRLDQGTAVPQWIDLLHQEDTRARRQEILALSDSEVCALGFGMNGKADREGLIARTAQCSQALLEHDRLQSDLLACLKERLKVPGEYSLPRRIIGFYPLVSLPVIYTTDRVHGRLKESFKADLAASPPAGTFVSFGPSTSPPLSSDEVNRLLGRSRENPLRIPLFSEADTKALVTTFAPTIVQDVVESYDRFGQVAWGGDRLEVATTRPAVYYYLSYALFKGEPVVQINYAFWYPERRGGKAPRIEWGRIDGLTIRASLDPRGTPFMVDIMNSCGCYHFYVPAEEHLDRIASKRFALDPFVPQYLPKLGPDDRLGVRVITGWHQVERVISVPEAEKVTPYELLPYDQLEALPRADGRGESMFDEHGIGKGANRPKEEVLFFSMGIPWVGAMRQRGNHAVLLVGRAYFDDPLLFEKNFEFK